MGTIAGLMSFFKNSNCISFFSNCSQSGFSVGMCVCVRFLGVKEGLYLFIYCYHGVLEVESSGESLFSCINNIANTETGLS